MTRTLIAYASKHGSTEQVARAIGAQLRAAGHDVDIREEHDVAPAAQLRDQVRECEESDDDEQPETRRQQERQGAAARSPS